MLSNGSFVKSCKTVFALFLIAALAGGGVAAQRKGSQHHARKTASASRSKVVPTPREVIGFTPGDDFKLATWAQIVDYFTKLDRVSDRVRLHLTSTGSGTHR